MLIIILCPIFVVFVLLFFFSNYHAKMSQSFEIFINYGHLAAELAPYIIKFCKIFLPGTNSRKRNSLTNHTQPYLILTPGTKVVGKTLSFDRIIKTHSFKVIKM